MTPTALTPATKALTASATLSNAGIGETLRRSIGGIYARSDQVAATEDWRGAMGIIVVNDLALAAGPTSIPGPLTDADDDGWVVWQGFSGAQGIDAQLTGGYFPFDSKGMRRVEEGFSLAIMFECSGVGCLVHLELSQYFTRH